MGVNLRIKNLKIIVFLLTFVLFGVSLMTMKVTTEAQIQGYGSECLDRVAECSGRQNVSTSIGSSIQLTGISSGEFETSLRSTYLMSGTTVDGAISELCISTNVTQVFPVRFTHGTDVVNRNNDLVPFYGDAAYIITPRHCEGSKTPLRQYSSLSIGAGSYATWSCCPADFVAVGQKSVSGEIEPDQMNGGCCRLEDPSASPGDDNYPVSTLGGRCYNLSGSEVSYTGTGRNFIPGSDSLGLAMGVGRNTIIREDIPGASQQCPPNNCAVVENRISGTRQIVSGGNTYRIINADGLLGDAAGADNTQCMRCFDDGEPMFVEDANTSSGTAAQLVVCNSDEAGIIEREPLVNNSIVDTLAVIRARERGDVDNAQFIAQCRSAGGIPTAIGCIDFTPLGIITGLIRIALGVVGGVSLVQLIIVGIQYQRGDDGKVKEARDKLIATLSGVAVLIFSVLILRILGVNILDVLPAGSV